MFEPRIPFTSSITGDLQRIESIRNLINLIPIMPHWESELRRTALINTVHYSTKIEGNILNREGVERLLAGHRVAGSEKDKQEVANLKQVMDFVHDISLDPSLPLSERLIKQINTYVLRDVPGASNIGDYRTGQNYIVDNKTGTVIFTPPPFMDVPKSMGELVEWLNQSKLGLSPILQAGVTHLELAAIHPFWDGNGRTARALATLILYRGGYELRRLFSWEEYVGTHIETYHQAIKKSCGDRYGDKYDLTPWLEYFCSTIANSLEKLRNHLEERKKYWDEGYTLGAKFSLKPYQIQALYYVFHFGDVTTSTYIQATGVSRATAVRHLAKLVNMGSLKVSGKGRAAKYVLGPVPKTIIEEEGNAEYRKGVSAQLHRENKNIGSPEVVDSNLTPATKDNDEG